MREARLAALLTVGFATVKLCAWYARTGQEMRALRRSLAWQAFDFGALVDAHRFMRGDLGIAEYEKRQDDRAKELLTGA